MKTPMIEKPTVSEVIFEMIKLRAGDAIPAGWDERARAAIIQHANERAALESVVSCAMIFVKRCEKGEIRSVNSLAMFRSAIADLAAVRAGNGGLK